MIIQIGTEVDESRILWKHKESDEWKRADIDDLIRAYEGRPRGKWENSEDCISRQQAIEEIALHDCTNGEVPYFTGKGVQEILNILPPVKPKPVCEDAISKHDLWRIIEDNAYWVTYNETSKEKGMTLTGINQALNECPPVEPERKKGVWIHEHIASDSSITGYYFSPKCSCSECGVIITCEANFCPECGADMRGETNEDNNTE